jgi:hypothetical protein
MHLLVNFVTIQNHITCHCTVAFLRFVDARFQIWSRPSDVTEAVFGVLIPPQEYPVTTEVRRQTLPSISFPTLLLILQMSDLLTASLNKP